MTVTSMAFVGRMRVPSCSRLAHYLPLQSNLYLIRRSLTLFRMASTQAAVVCLELLYVAPLT